MPDDRFLHRKAGHGRKPNSLSSDEHRVWTQYILSADDFGVMRASAVTLRSDNDFFDTKTEKQVQRWLEAVVAIGLLLVFSHQGRRYVCQWDWQSWQKVSYPRATNNPVPTPECLALCDEPTRKLFVLHPGGAGRTRKDGSENVQKTDPECSPLMRERGHAKRLTANGERLVANGSEGGAGETGPPFDKWFHELVMRYPSNRRNSSPMAMQSFMEILKQDADVHPAQAFSALMARLDSQIQSHEWRVKGMAPRLDRYLASGAHLQEHDEDPPAAEQLTSKTQRTAHAISKIMGGES